MSSRRTDSPIESSEQDENRDVRGQNMGLSQEQPWGRRRRQAREEEPSTSREITEEELIRELALLGFTGIPRERLLEFKQDLEELMERRAGVIPGPEGDMARSTRTDLTPDTSLSSSDISAQRSWPGEVWGPSDQRQNPAVGSSLDGAMGLESSAAVPAHIERGAWADLAPWQGQSSSRGSLLIGLPRSSATREWSHNSSGPPQNDSYIRQTVAVGRQWPSVPLADNPPKSSHYQVGRLELLPSDSEGSSSQDTGVRPPVVMKRKVLRRRQDGQTQVSDESVTSEVDSDFWGLPIGLNGESDSGTGSELSSSDSQLDLWGPRPASWDRHKSFIRPRMDPLLNGYRKRTDPVAKYMQYKQDWDSMQASVDKSRKQLRWGVREQMMCKPPQVISRPHRVYVPNQYVVPTEKKRYALRWGVRYDLVNGIIPKPN